MTLMAMLPVGCATAPFVQASPTEKPYIYRVYSNIAALRAVNPAIEHTGSPGVNEAAITIASMELRKQGWCLTEVEIYNPAQIPSPVATLERSNEVLYLVRCIK